MSLFNAKFWNRYLQVNRSNRKVSLTKMYFIVCSLICNFSCYLHLLQKCHLFKHDHNVYMLNIHHLINATIVKSKVQVPHMYTCVYIIPPFCWGKTMTTDINWLAILQSSKLSLILNTFLFWTIRSCTKLVPSLNFNIIGNSFQYIYFWKFLLLSNLLYSCTRSGIIHSDITLKEK